MSTEILTGKFGVAVKIKLKDGKRNALLLKTPQPANTKNLENLLGQDSLHLCDFPSCGKRFPRPSNLKLHQLIHRASRPFKCGVEGCVASYARNQHLSRHFKLTHEKRQGAFRCLEEGCLSSFDTYSSVSQHFRRVHYGRKLDKAKSGLACEKCNEEFPSLTQLQKHKILIHRIKCKECSRVFYNELRLREHETYHVIKLPQPKICILCNIELTNYDAFDAHQKSEEHLKNQAIAWTCTVCKQSFHNKHNFNTHLKTHDKKRPRHGCTYVEGCDKFYYSRKCLKQHIRAVHEKDIFQQPTCSICDREFSSKQKLVYHMKIIHDPNYVKTNKRKPPSAEDIRKKLIRSLSGKQRASGKELFRVTKPGKKRKVPGKVDLQTDPPKSKNPSPTVKRSNSTKENDSDETQAQNLQGENKA